LCWKAKYAIIENNKTTFARRETNMRGHMYVVGGDPSMARNTVYTSLANQGFTLTPIDDWNAEAERGSKGASIAFGALAGKQGRHVKIRVACQTVPEGIMVTLTQGTSGASGGLIGMNQASAIYTDIYNAVGAAFQNAGVLISNNVY